MIEVGSRWRDRTDSLAGVEVVVLKAFPANIYCGWPLTKIARDEFLRRFEPVKEGE